MSLIDEKRAAELYNLMGPTTEMSSGSAGNVQWQLTPRLVAKACMAKSQTINLEKSLPDTRAIGVRTPTFNGWPRHRSMPDLGHTRCPTHHEHVLGASTRLKSEDINEDWLPIPKSPIWKVICLTMTKPKPPLSKPPNSSKHGRKLSSLFPIHSAWFVTVMTSETCGKKCGYPVCKWRDKGTGPKFPMQTNT